MYTAALADAQGGPAPVLLYGVRVPYDTVWGFCPVERTGQNLLARIWMRVRAELE